MPGDRMSVPVVVRAAGPKFETDTAEHLLRRIYLPDGVIIRHSKSATIFEDI